MPNETHIHDQAVHLARNLDQKLSRRRFLGGGAGAAGAAALSALPVAARAAAAGGQAPAIPAVLRVNASRAVNRFAPNQALGSSMDNLTPTRIQQVYTPADVKLCLSTGWGPITYRLFTELARNAWHWNPNGSWSDAAHQRGYFVGSAELGAPIHDSFAYEIEHRGAGGGDAGGYSRLTDGNPQTFWKSNPYLDSHFTGQSDDAHPQWAILNLRSREYVNAIRIDWCEPSAVVYEVQYWEGSGDPLDWENVDLDRFRTPGPLPRLSQAAPGRWRRFPNGLVTDGKGGTAMLKLSEKPLQAQFVRILMSQSSHRPSPDANGGDYDARHRCGYAIYEISVGMVLPEGSFADLVTHSADLNQTPTTCSSEDCYHTAGSRSKRGDQTGMDLFFTSGITNNLPAMIPVAVLYSTPEDAAHQILYLKRRGYPVAWIEMGEECDGKHCMPEDYAELYIQFAEAIHKVVPEAKIGGPALQGIDLDIWVWPDAQGRTSWTERFIDYLKSRGHLQDLTFFSFERYPFSARNISWDDLFLEPEMNHALLAGLRRAGVPERVPLMIDESSIAASVTEDMSEIFSGLWLADSVGSFLRYGGAAYYHSPIQPQPNFRGARGYATWSNFVSNQDLKVSGYTAFYYVGQLINKQWVTHGAGVHELYAVDGGIVDDAGRVWITAYAVRRPDGDWALMIVNKDRDRAHRVRVAFSDPAGGRAGYFSGPVHMATFGSEQYVWHGATMKAYADPDDPPHLATLHGGQNATFTLPRASVTILRGRIAGLA